MNRKDWRTVSVSDVEFDSKELNRQLLPTLRIRSDEFKGNSYEYGERLVRECRDGLSALLPFSNAEREFLNLLLDQGRIDASLLTSDKDLRERIESQPLLKWKAMNVRQHKGLP